jgi:serine/threonine-protein kinase
MASTDASTTRTLAGRYRLGPTIGTGPNAKVFDAVDLTDGSPVVVKMLPASFGASGGFMRRFNADVQAAADLSHPNLTPIKDFGVEKANGRSFPFVVTELQAGGSLRGILDRGRQLTPSQALLVGLDVCRGLDYAHRRGLIHGAITPANILFGLDRKARIVDFGLSRLMGEVAWADPGRVDVHVAHYASPEQAMGLPIDAASDVYSLCLSLIESVTGQVPFAADTTVTTLTARIDKLMPVSADLGALASVLERGGRPRLEDRFTAAEFGRALVLAAENLPRPEPIPIVGSGLFGDVTGTLPSAGGPSADQLVAEAPADLTGVLARTEAAAGEQPTPSPTPDGVPLAADERPSFSPAPARPVPERVPEPNVPPPTDDAVPEAVVRPSITPASGAVSPRRHRPPPGPAIDPMLAPQEPAEPPEPLADPPALPVAEPAVVADEDLWGTGPVPVVLPAATLAEVPDLVHDGTVELPEIVSGESPVLLDPGLAGGLLDDAGIGEVGADWAAAAAHRKATATVESVEGDDDALNLDRRRVFVYVLVALGLVIAAVIGIVGYRALGTPSHVVPNLIGVSEAEATNQVAANGWQLEVRRQSDDTQVQGNVVRTEPAAGDKLKKGATFVMVVSNGPTLATVPEIAGMSLDQARASLTAAGLTVREAKRVANESVAAGMIISWSVPAQAGIVAGGQVPKGTTIEVVVSAGPAPRKVPGLVGLTIEEARQKLAAQGLVLGTIASEFNDQVAVGLVITSDPATGAKAAKGASVNVTVSKGADLATVPKLIGLTKAQVDQVLADAGLVLGSITGPVDGVVAGTDFAAGTKVPKGTKISVVFGTA